MKNSILILLGAIFILSCNGRTTGKTEEKVSQQVMPENDKGNYSLIGRKGIIHYPSVTVEVQYLSDSTFHWKIVSSKEVAEDIEKTYYKQLTPNLHFLNWVEKDGNVISQVIDTKKGTIKTFWSYVDEKSDRAKRSAIFEDGTIEFKR